MKPSIVVYKKELPQELISKLQSSYDVKVFDRLKLSNPDLVEALKSTVGIVGWGGRIGEDLLSLTPNLKAVSTISVGYDHCDVPLLTKNKVG